MVTVYWMGLMRTQDNFDFFIFLKHFLHLLFIVYVHACTCVMVHGMSGGQTITFGRWLSLLLGPRDWLNSGLQSLWQGPLSTELYCQPNFGSLICNIVSFHTHSAPASQRQRFTGFCILLENLVHPHLHSRFSKAGSSPRAGTEKLT